MSAARDVVEVIAKALADRPEAVTVVEAQHHGTTLVEIYVGGGEVGRLIGRQGRTAAAIRTLASAAGEREGTRTVAVEIRDTPYKG
jgi:predicted RNA-binding protein YlqC (UPF0109 family)